MIDCHCHLLQLHPPGAALARARAEGVDAVVAAGVGPEHWPALEALATHAGVGVVLGLHPWWVATASLESVDTALAALDARLSARPAGLVGVGEVGLDRGPRVDRRTLPVQEHALRGQLALARAHDLPVVLHVVRAHGRALELVAADGLPPAGGLVHGFGGPAELVSSWVALGACLSVGGSVTWPGARRVHQAVAAIPADRLLVETDAPDRPVHGAERGEPAHLGTVVAAVARLRGEAVSAVAETTRRNTLRLFPTLATGRPATS